MSVHVEVLAQRFLARTVAVHLVFAASFAWIQSPHAAETQDTFEETLDKSDEAQDLDVAFGGGESAFYFRIGEAF